MAGKLTYQEWQGKAACRGPQGQEFFPPPHSERRDEKRRREARAKAICSRCTVAQMCLEYAVQIRETHGIWGGTSESERRELIGLSA